MGQFSLSPSVDVKEQDFSAIVPAVATSIGAFAGTFAWGPANQRITVDSETTLARLFGKPSDANAADWFTARNFLSYANNLKLVRVVNSATSRNSVAAATATLVNNYDVFVAVEPGGTLAANKLIARYAGVLGNGLEVSFADAATFGTWKYRNFFTTAQAANVATKTTTVSFTATSVNGQPTLTNVNVVSGTLVVGQTISGTNVTGSPTILSMPNSSTIILSSGAGVTTGTSTTMSGTVNQTVTTWSGQPGSSNHVQKIVDVNGVNNPFQSGVTLANDEIHVVVVDKNGLFTGAPGSILEKYTALSKAADAIASDGSVNYYKEVINRRSNYVYVTALETVSGGAVIGSQSTTGTAFGSLSTAPVYSFSGGIDGTVTNADRIGVPSTTNLSGGFYLFRNSEEVDVSLVFGGVCDDVIARYLIDQIAEYRKDCVAFVSPALADVLNASGNEETNVLTFRNKLNPSSYAVMDTGWKYQYDAYNDKNRWVPLNADIAGLCALTDQIADAWWSPAGFNRGYIKDVLRLAWNPTAKAARDNLYTVGINAVVGFPNLGYVLYGDKTLQAKASAFDRINVRRLFIILEKAISTYSKFVLFEFNDSITRSRFKNAIVPYLRDIAGRRGIYDYKVVVDETVNTPEVIDSNAFVANIYIKPARSVNFITLNFIAVATGTSFEEVV